MTRKLISQLLSLCIIAMLILPLCVISAGADENQYPTISKIEATSQVLEAGDSFTITVYASHPSGIWRADAEVFRVIKEGEESSSYKSVRMHSVGDNQFEATFDVDETWVAGEYKISSVRLIPNEGSGYEFSDYNSDVIPTEVVFTVKTNNTDTTGPELTKVEASSETVKVGESITIVVYASDPNGVDAGMSEVSIRQKSDSDVPHYMVHSLEEVTEGKYQVVFKTTSWAPGTYTLEKIHLYDENGNISYYDQNVDEGGMLPIAVYTVVDDSVSPSPEPSEDPEPSESPEPSEDPEPSESPEPSEDPAPSESPKPSEDPKPSESLKPSESPQPSESPAPSESPKPSDSPGPAEPESFVDVEEGSWYEDAVNYCASMGYMEGTGDNKFDPDYTVTRGTIAQILYAQSGKPTVDSKSDFTDVKEDKWYSDAVAWAAEEGVVAGYTDGTYKPDDPITRQQMVAILYKYAQLNGYDTTANGDLSKFKDADKLSKYAVTPMKWAVGHGVISGTDVGLEPNATATRAQVAVILQAFDKNVKD